MAVFQTGNPLWDNGLNAGATGLAGLFDQSKAAQAGLYGAETGKTILEAQKLRYQQGKMEGLEGDLAGVFGPSGAAPLSAQPVAPTAPVAAPAPAPPMAVAPTAPSPLATTVAPDPWGGAPTPDPVSGPTTAPAPAVTPTPTAGAGFIQAPGGGVKQAPPAQANGSAAPPVDLSRIVIHAIQGGAAPEQIAHMAGAILNGMVLSGRLDRPTANAMMASMGAPSAYVADVNSRTQITTTGMTQAGETQRTGMASQHVIRVSDGAEMDVPLAELNAHPDLYRHYDSARQQAGDVKRPVASIPGDPASPPVYQADRNLTGQTPSDQAMIEADAKPINIITPDNKLVGTTVGAYRRNPAMGRPATQQDETYIRVSPKPGATPVVVPQGTAGDMRPLPTSTDAGVAETQSRAGAAAEAGDKPLAETIIGSAQDAAAGVSSRTPMTVDDLTKSKTLGANHFNQMYPVGSGWSPLSSTAPATPSQVDQDYHDRLVLALQRGSLKANPGAAEAEAWDQMRRDGILPSTIHDRRRIGVNPTGAYTDLVSVGKDKTGKDQMRLVIHGDYSRVPKDAAGNPIVQGVGGPRMPSLTGGAPVASTSAPTAPTASPGSAAAASTQPSSDAAPPGARRACHPTNRRAEHARSHFARRSGTRAIGQRPPGGPVHRASPLGGEAPGTTAKGSRQSTHGSGTLTGGRRI
jgi:hypothetical protein